MDDLERRIRAARPVSGNRYMPLTDRAKRELAEMLLADSQVAAVPVVRPARGPRLGMRWLVWAATSAVVLVVGGMWWQGPQPVHAATPPLLVIEPLAESSAEPVAALALAARESDFNVPAEGDEVVIRLEQWALSMEEVGGDIDPSLTAISPEVHTATFRPDGSMSQVFTVGRSWEAEGTVEQDPPAGTVIGTYEEGPGGYEPMFAPAPRDSNEVEQFLTVGGGLAARESASNAFMTISYLLREQRLDGPQTAALLEFLATLPDYTVEGITTDRLDRSALVLSAPRADGEYTDSLLLDPKTGQILALETTYIGTSRADLTAPAVTEYHAWENNT